MAIRYLTNGDPKVGNQFVTKQNGRVNYDPINQSQYTDALAGASNNNFRNQLDFQNGLADTMVRGERQSPLTQANVFSTRTNAQVNLMDAETRRIQAQAEARDKVDSNRPYVPTTRDRLFNPELQSPMSYANKMKDGVNRFKPYFEFANNRANRDLDKFLADSRVSETRINADAQLGVARMDKEARLGTAQLGKEGQLGTAQLNKEGQLGTAQLNKESNVESTRIQQPLSAKQMLDKTRIENPDPMKGMAMNMLGGYSSGNGARSNFAYWG